MEQWRDRMVSTLSSYIGTPRQEQVGDGRFSGIGEPAQQTIDERTVAKIMAKETLKFAREHMPRIDAFVNSLKVEFSSEKLVQEEAGEKSDAIKYKMNTGDHKAGVADQHKVQPALQDKLFYKTGLRVRVDSGKLGLVSESEAKYGKASYFLKVNLDNQSDNSMGVRYVLSKATTLQIERDFSQTMNPATKNRPSINVVRLGFNF